MILGIDSTFRRGARGTPEPAYDDEALKASLEQILNTALGERVMRPTFGTSTLKRVFDNVGPAQRAALKHDVQTKIALWEPRVRVVRINVDSKETKKGVATSMTVQYVRRGADRTVSPATITVPVGS